MQLQTALCKLIHRHLKVPILVETGEERPSIHSAQLQSVQEGLKLTLGSQDQSKSTV